MVVGLFLDAPEQNSTVRPWTQMLRTQMLRTQTPGRRRPDADAPDADTLVADVDAPCCRSLARDNLANA